MNQANKIAKQCNDVYLNSDSTVVIDAGNEGLRHFLYHMNKSLEEALSMECQRAISDSKQNTSAIINRHINDINDYINSNICDIIKDSK